MTGTTAVSHSIVIPTIARPVLLERTLRALEAQSCAVQEVIVACDGPDAQTEELAARFSAHFRSVWIFLCENRGQAAARNAGARAATGDVLLFLDDETLPQPEWLATHLRHHATLQPKVVLGALRDVFEQPPKSFVEKCMRMRTNLVVSHLQAALAQPANIAFPHYWIGLNTSLPRRSFAALGGFDENLRYVQEDSELAARAWRAGVQFVYEPKAVVQHLSSRSLSRKHCDDAVRFGASDVYRVRELREPPTGTHAARIRGLPPWRRRLEALAWRHPQTLACVAGALRHLANLTRSRFFFWRWAGLAFSVGYWDGVKSCGVDTREAAVLFDGDR